MDPAHRQLRIAEAKDVYLVIFLAILRLSAEMAPSTTLEKKDRSDASRPVCSEC